MSDRDLTLLIITSLCLMLLFNQPEVPQVTTASISASPATVSLSYYNP